MREVSHDKMRHDRHGESVTRKPILKKRLKKVTSQDRFAKVYRYIQSAELLMRDGDHESSLSRAYYAVLHAAIALLIAYGLPEAEEWKTHVQILNTCAREDRRYTWFHGIRFVGGTGGLQRSLAALHAQRDDADYAIGKITPTGAQEALRFAREFIRRVEEKIRERERQEKR
jgi:uncharacterized protein (UPF0332 family)